MSEPFPSIAEYYTAKAGEIAIDFIVQMSQPNPTFIISKGTDSLLLATLIFPKFLQIPKVSFANAEVHQSNTAPIRWFSANTVF